MHDREPESAFAESERLKSEQPRIIQERRAVEVMQGRGVMRGDLARVVAQIQQQKAVNDKAAARKAKRKNAKKARRAARR